MIIPVFAMCHVQSVLAWGRHGEMGDVPKECHPKQFLIAPIFVHLMQRCHRQSRVFFQGFVPKTQKKNTTRVIHGFPSRVIVTCLSQMKLNGPMLLEVV